MAEIRVNATGGLKLFDADDSHYAQIIAGTITSNVDALTLGHASADFNIPVKVLGTTPTLTIGDAGAEDTKIVFDGNAQDFYIALDDSADDLLIGKGSTVGTTPAIAIDENLKVNIPVTTASTSASTGSLTTGGGAGIGADLYVGDDTYLITDSAVLGFGADKDTTLTHTDGTGLTLNSTNKLCFNDATQFIQGASGTVLDIAATDEIELTSTLIEAVGRLEVTNGAIFNEASADVDFRVESNGNANMLHVDGGNDGVGIGTTGGGHTLQVNDTTDFVSGSSNVANTAPLNVRSAASSGNIGAISIGGNDNVALYNPSSNKLGLQAYDYIGFFVSNTNDDKVGTKTERARLNADGIFALGNAALSAGAVSDSTIGASLHPDGRVKMTMSGTANEKVMYFYNGNGEVGSVSCSGSATAFNTSSDYRLKENETSITDGIDRIKELKPYKFNFKTDKDEDGNVIKIVDGFFAHEVSGIVPEAIKGEKDAMHPEVLYTADDELPEGKEIGDVKEETKINAQGIDQAKLVPVTVACLKELITKIETLETKVTALEG